MRHTEKESPTNSECGKNSQTQKQKSGTCNAYKMQALYDSCHDHSSINGRRTVKNSVACYVTVCHCLGVQQEPSACSAAHGTIYR